jgi:hypothetical protein
MDVLEGLLSLTDTGSHVHHQVGDSLISFLEIRGFNSLVIIQDFVDILVRNHHTQVQVLNISVLRKD